MLFQEESEDAVSCSETLLVFFAPNELVSVQKTNYTSSCVILPQI